MNDLPVSFQPQAGEIWMCDVVVRRQDDNEILYQLVDAWGAAYGKVLSLSKDSFERRFKKHGPSYIMQVKVIECNGKTVLYQELDAQGGPVHEPKRISIEIFARNFRRMDNT